MTSPSSNSVAVRSTLESDGRVRVVLDQVPAPEPADDEVVVAVEAAPVNPSDIGQLFGLADLDTLATETNSAGIALVARASPEATEAMRHRVGVPMPAGNEGAGHVVMAGRNSAAQALLGKTVATLAGGMYATLRVVKAQGCLVLPDGLPAEAGAAAFVNPLTALGFVETMRAEKRTALVHTVAASNLGRMLVRVCRDDGVPLVNIVRTTAQEKMLRGEGAEHVVDSSRDGFADRLTDAIAATGATIAFDAVGGGELAGIVLWCMERALLRQAGSGDRYGSPVHKHVYIYGGLQPGPTVLRQDVGKAWSVSGWLLTPFLQGLPATRRAALNSRVIAGLRTTFQSDYGERIRLDQLVDLEVARRYTKRATGAKFLVCPQLS